VPGELAARAFDLEEARDHGLSKDHLNGYAWTRVARRVYAPTAVAEMPMVRLAAAMRRVESDAVFSGRTAAWLHGIDSELRIPIEVTLAPSSRVSRRVGLVVRRRALDTNDVVLRKGLRTTSAVRTSVDLGSRLPLVDAVVALDLALHCRLVSVEEIRRWADAHCGRRGVRCLRRALELVEPAAESVMETRLRLILVLAGLPRPRAQVPLFDAAGGFLGRPDLFYPDHRLALEYDGASHRASLAADNRRQNGLIEAGYRLLRFTAADVLGTPAAVIALVRRALAG
jgi:very-short-patch-repair endonuclease